MVDVEEKAPRGLVCRALINSGQRAGQQCGITGKYQLPLLDGTLEPRCRRHYKSKVNPWKAVKISQRCHHIYRSGEKEGKRCGNKVAGNYCHLHLSSRVKEKCHRCQRHEAYENGKATCNGCLVFDQVIVVTKGVQESAITWLRCDQKSEVTQFFDQDLFQYGRGRGIGELLLNGVSMWRNVIFNYLGYHTVNSTECNIAYYQEVLILTIRDRLYVLDRNHLSLINQYHLPTVKLINYQVTSYSHYGIVLELKRALVNSPFIARYLIIDFKNQVIQNSDIVMIGPYRIEPGLNKVANLTQFIECFGEEIVKTFKHDPRLVNIFTGKVIDLKRPSSEDKLVDLSFDGRVLVYHDKISTKIVCGNSILIDNKIIKERLLFDGCYLKEKNSSKIFYPHLGIVKEHHRSFVPIFNKKCLLCRHDTLKSRCIMTILKHEISSDLLPPTLQTQIIQL